MATPVVGALSFNDALTYKEKVSQDIIRTSRCYAPLFQKHMKRTGSMGSKCQWFQQAITQGYVTLASGYTAGDATITVTAPSNYNPFQTLLKAGISSLRTVGGGLTWSVDALDSATAPSVLTVTVTNGSDVNIASGTKITIIRNTEVGEDFGTQNDTSVASSDINYFTNFSYTLKIANPVARGQFEHFGQNELTFAQQLANLTPDAIRNIERGVAKGQRIEGSNPAVTGGFSRTAGTGSEAGGIVSFIQSGGGYVPTTAASVSEDLLEQDFINLRERGAFSTMTDYERSMGINTCDIYMTEATLGDLQKNVRLERPAEKTMSSQFGGTWGSFVGSYTVNGVRGDFNISDGMGDDEVLYVPRKEQLQVDVVRFLDKEGETVFGDNTTMIVENTYTTKVFTPWTLGYRTNLVRV